MRPPVFKVTKDKKRKPRKQKPPAKPKIIKKEPRWTIKNCLSKNYVRVNKNQRYIIMPTEYFGRSTI